jgi:hypothetical protein
MKRNAQLSTTAYNIAANTKKKLKTEPQPMLIMSRAKTREAIPTSRIIEAKNLSDLEGIINFLPPNSLVAFDLDNMTMEPLQTIGSDQWFEAMIHNLTQKYDNNMQLVYDELVPLYNHVHTHTAVKAVEPHTPLFIHKLHAKHKVVALTNRGKEIAIATHKQLASIDVNFNHYHAHKDREIDFSHVGSATQFVNGIIFAGGKNKGDCLKAFMHAMGYNSDNTPHILFLDDKQHNLERVRNACLELGIKFTGVRYGHLDEKIKQVDLEIAHVQHKHHPILGRFLTDDEARKLIQESTATEQAQPHKLKP